MELSGMHGDRRTRFRLYAYAMRALAGSVAILFHLTLPAFGEPREEIRALFERDFVEAWQAADPEALAELWVSDGDWSSIVGSRRIVRGSEGIRQVWEIGLGQRSTAVELELRIAIDNVRLLPPDRALVDLVMTFAPRTEAVMREAFVMVVTDTEEGWRIESARAARLPNR